MKPAGGAPPSGPAGTGSRSELRVVGTSVTREVELLLDWAGVGKKDVPDPYYGNSTDFERAFKLIDSAATGIATRLHEGRY